MLKRVQILANLNEPQLISLSHKLVKRVFAEGEVIIKQGDIGKPHAITQCFVSYADLLSCR